ncbi:MAG TPA: hypothetical protein VF292_06515 [Rhodanobacteraceae bacterium]
MPSPIREPLHRNGYRIFPAIVIVALAVLFLARNAGLDLAWLQRGNAWALFVLVGAVPPLALAYGAWRRHGRFNAAAACYLSAGVSVVMVASVFLAHLSLATWWPLFMLTGAAYTLMPSSRHADRTSRDDAGSTRW